jgi:LmbE family N-acetylglucosaminyl deacetylase
MKTPNLSRRTFVKQSLAISAPAMLAANALSQDAAEARASSAAERTLKVVCVGGHPDDPESGCAGALARYAAAGHEVAIIYLTRGERGIQGKTLDEAAKIRSAECEAACKIMGARPLFAGQIDGATEVNKARVDALAQLLIGQQPDVIFTHWPVDTHLDHQAASLLTYRAYLGSGRLAQLYFFEVNTGSQTQGFTPNVYVDITQVLEKKKAALFAHRSQDGEGIWRQHHEPVAVFRGREAGVPMAEAFFHLNCDSKTSKLPGI